MNYQLNLMIIVTEDNINLIQYVRFSTTSNDNFNVKRFK